MGSSMVDEHPLEQFRLAEQERRGKPLRRRDFAKELGFSPSRYTQLTKYREMPSSALARRVEDKIGIPAGTLINAAKEPEAAQ